MSSSADDPLNNATPPEIVGDSEILMRRVLPMSKNYKHNSNPPIQEGAFVPRPSDKDGISLSRRKSVQFPQFLSEHQFRNACGHKDPKMKEGCGVCSVLAAEVRICGVNIVYDPVTNDPGHVHLREINFTDWEVSEEKRRDIRLIISKMIEFASQAGNTLIIPSDSKSNK